MRVLSVLAALLEHLGIVPACPYVLLAHLLAQDVLHLLLLQS
jgi:hypothetical protein